MESQREVKRKVEEGIVAAVVLVRGVVGGRGSQDANNM
jgi:hypothetical protein